MKKPILPGQLQVPSTVPPYTVVALSNSHQELGVDVLEALIYDPDKCRERVIEHALGAPDNVPVGMISSGTQATVLCDAKGWALRLLRKVDDARWLVALENAELNADTIMEIVDKVAALRTAAIPKKGK